MTVSNTACEVGSPGSGNITLAEVSDASQAVAAVAVVVSLAILIRQNYEANILGRDEAVRRQIEGIQNISRELFEAPGLAGV